jgi:ribosomal protein L11 methylase PrmA
MSEACLDTGSFRDPSGRIYHLSDRIYRTVMPSARNHFEFVRSTGLIEKLVSQDLLIDETRVDTRILGSAAATACYLLEHPKLPFVSYPYEWSFSALKAAALLQLDIQIESLDHGVALSDATAYNIQFQGPRPIFIDHLSFRPYEEGEYWSGHSQFCDQFLNPLLLQSLLGTPYHAWYRGSLEGITAEELNDVLPWYRKLSWNAFTNVTMQARLQSKTRSSNQHLERAVRTTLPRTAFKAMIESMRNGVASLEPRSLRKTDWQDYADNKSYDSAENAAKKKFVGEFVTTVSPGMLWDVGCNTGEFAVVALENGAGQVVGFDFDHRAVERAYIDARERGLNFLPLVIDAVNPSPAQGWAQVERGGLKERNEADAVLGLALIHHLAIGKNIPLYDAVTWLTGLAPNGVIEFVQKSDPMVRQLLRLRHDIFDDYNQQAFETYLAESARIVKSEVISTEGRTLYWYARD